MIEAEAQELKGPGVKGLRKFRDRFELPLSDADLKKYSSTARPTTPRRCATCSSGARPSAGSSRPGTRSSVPCQPPKPESFARALQGTPGREGPVHHPGLGRR